MEIGCTSLTYFFYATLKGKTLFNQKLYFDRCPEEIVSKTVEKTAS